MSPSYSICLTQYPISLYPTTNSGGPMPVVSDSIPVKTKGGVDIIALNDQVAKAIKRSGLKDGIATVFCPGATGVVTTLEYENGVLGDVDDALERLFPKDMPYKHHLKWNDGNGHSHVRAAMLGPSLTVPFNGGKPILGTWQEIVFIELDNKPRSRDIIVQIIGE